MPLAGEEVQGLRSSGGWNMWVPGLMSTGQGVGPSSYVQEGGVLYSEVQCINGNGDMGPPQWMNSHAPVKALTFHNFVGRR